MFTMISRHYAFVFEQKSYPTLQLSETFVHLPLLNSDLHHIIDFSNLPLCLASQLKLCWDNCNCIFLCLSTKENTTQLPVSKHSQKTIIIIIITTYDPTCWIVSTNTMGDVEHCWTRLDFHQTTLPNLLDNVNWFQTCQPPKHADLEILQKNPRKTWRLGPQPADFQNMHQLKIKMVDFLFQGILYFICVPYSILLLLLLKSQFLFCCRREPPVWVHCSQL